MMSIISLIVSIIFMPKHCKFPNHIVEILQLRFDENRSFRQIAETVPVSASSAHKLVQRFHAIGGSWPLPKAYTPSQLEEKLYPASAKKSSTQGQQKKRRPNFSAEFKRNLVEQSLLPGACVAQIARDNGINDNQLFNWRHRYNRELQEAGNTQTLHPELIEVLPITLGESVHYPPAAVPSTQEAKPLCCELTLSGATLRMTRNGRCSTT
ncbi:TPA: IS66-like element accessory protein TnpA [Yersinia enterocolitica]